MTGSGASARKSASTSKWASTSPAPPPPTTSPTRWTTRPWRSACEYVEASGFALVEALAENIARLILEEFPVSRVRLVLNKTGAVRGARDVGVIIERAR